MNLKIIIEQKNPNNKDWDNSSWAYNFKFVFNKAYGDNFSNINYLENLKNLKINKGDFILLAFFPKIKLLKSLKKFINEKEAFLGINFGDSAQYFETIFSYYCNFLDFCFTQEPGDAYMYEFFCGLAAFHHPINAIRTLDYYKNSLVKNKNLKRSYDFVHIGRFDNERQGRMDLKNNILKTKSKYLLLGPSRDCEFVKINQLHNRLSNCNFGLVNCAAPSSSPLSTIKTNNQFQFKGKIWEYILAGCIPVLDYAPNTYKFNLREGIHYLRFNNFSKSNLEELSFKDQKTIEMMRNSLFALAERECSAKSLKESFDEFQQSSMLHAPKKINPRLRKELILDACHDYSIERKRVSFSIIISGFYFTKIINKFLGKLY